MNGLMNKVLGLIVVGIMIAVGIPIAMTFFTDADTTGWQSQWITIFNNLPTIIMVVVLLAVLLIVVVTARGKKGM